MLFILLRRLNVDKHWKQGFRKASVLLCSISRTVVPETHFIKPIKRALVVSCCPSNGPWGTVYVKCMNICELIFFSLFFSWHWLAHVGLCLWHYVWRGNLEYSPGSGPEVDGGAASEGRCSLVLHEAVRVFGPTAVSGLYTFRYIGKWIKNVLVNLGIIGFIGLPWKNNL